MLLFFEGSSKDAQFWKKNQEWLILINKNALGSVESCLFVDKIRSEEANRARAFVTRGGGGEGALRI